MEFTVFLTNFDNFNYNYTQKWPTNTALLPAVFLTINFDIILNSLQASNVHYNNAYNHVPLSIHYKDGLHSPNTSVNKTMRMSLPWTIPIRFLVVEQKLGEQFQTWKTSVPPCFHVLRNTTLKFLCLLIMLINYM